MAFDNILLCELFLTLHNFHPMVQEQYPDAIIDNDDIIKDWTHLDSCFKSIFDAPNHWCVELERLETTIQSWLNHHYLWVTEAEDQQYFVVHCFGLQLQVSDQHMSYLLCSTSLLFWFSRSGISLYIPAILPHCTKHICKTPTVFCTVWCLVGLSGH